MNNFVLFLFALNFSLLVAHELDAVRGAEWRMLPVLKNMRDPEACGLFIALHVPILAILLCMLLGSARIAGFLIVDLFLVAHTALHILFRRHRQNNLNNPLSLGVVYAMGLLAVLHLALRAGW